MAVKSTDKVPVGRLKPKNMIESVHIDIRHTEFARMSGNTTIDQHVPLRGLKEKPKRAVIAYYDDVLGNVESK